MDKKTERLTLAARKAAVKASLKRRHVVTEEELLGLKVQTLSAASRLTMGVLAFASAVGSTLAFTFDRFGWGWILALATLVLAVLAIYGIRRTFGKIVDNLGDAGQAAEVVGNVLEGTASVIGGIFEGL